MQVHKKVVENTLVRCKEEGFDITQDELLKVIDGFFRAAAIAHDEKKHIKFPYLFESSFDPDKKGKLSKIYEMANAEVDKLIAEKGSVSKKELREELINATRRFKHIKRIKE